MFSKLIPFRQELVLVMVLVLEENTTAGLMILPIIRIIIVKNSKNPVDGHVATATWDNKQGGTVRDTTTRKQ